MAHFANAVEYALHTVLNLGLLDDAEQVTSRQLAQVHDLPLPFMRKLLSKLERAGLIVAREGRAGGWRLARPLGEITYLAVTDAVSDDPRLFHCAEIRFRLRGGATTCPADGTAPLCGIHKVMLSAEAAMRERLASVTLAETAQELRERTGTAWLIQRIEGL